MLSDVTFVIDGQRLPANKAILSFKSVVFNAQFSADFADSDQKEIIITDATVVGFKAMLWFIHTEELVFDAIISVAQWFDVYNLSQKYKLKRFAELIEYEIKSRVINADNFADIYEYGFERGFARLTRLAKQFIRLNIEDLVDKCTNWLIGLNNKTNNSLFKVIVRKFRQTRGRSDKRKKKKRLIPPPRKC